MADLAAGHTTFTHGDYRIANTFLGGKGEGDCVAIDWQNCGTHTGMRDVSYLLTSSAFPESRRKIERDVLEEYHDAVSSMGVSDYGLGECWRDYRRAMLSCLIGPVLTIGALDWSQSRAYE